MGSAPRFAEVFRGAVEPLASRTVSCKRFFGGDIVRRGPSDHQNGRRLGLVAGSDDSRAKR